MTKKKKVLICGCGKIAGGYNQYSDTSKSISHAHAINNSKKFELHGCIDVNKSNLNKYSKYWDIKHKYNNFSDVKKEYYDLIVISSPDKYHLEHLNEALKLNPKAIFIEKPVASSIKDIFFLKKIKNKNICVNYSRSWDKRLTNIRKKIIDSQYVDCVMTGKTMNSGSHMLNLMQKIFGHMSILSAKKYNDIVMLSFKSKNTLINLTIFENNNNFDLFEFTSFNKHGTISMLNNGINWGFRDIEKNLHFNNLRYLNKKTTFKKGAYLDVLNNAYENINAFIDKGETLECTLTNAIETEALLIKSKEMLKK